MDKLHYIKSKGPWSYLIKSLLFIFDFGVLNPLNLIFGKYVIPSSIFELVFKTKYIYFTDYNLYLKILKSDNFFVAGLAIVLTFLFIANLIVTFMISFLNYDDKKHLILKGTLFLLLMVFLMVFTVVHNNKPSLFLSVNPKNLTEHKYIKWAEKYKNAIEFEYGARYDKLNLSFVDSLNSKKQIDIIPTIVIHDGVEILENEYQVVNRSYFFGISKLNQRIQFNRSNISSVILDPIFILTDLISLDYFYRKANFDFCRDISLKLIDQIDYILRNEALFGMDKCELNYLIAELMLFRSNILSIQISNIDKSFQILYGLGSIIEDDCFRRNENFYDFKFRLMVERLRTDLIRYKHDFPKECLDYDLMIKCPSAKMDYDDLRNKKALIDIFYKINAHRIDVVSESEFQRLIKDNSIFSW